MWTSLKILLIVINWLYTIDLILFPYLCDAILINWIIYLHELVADLFAFILDHEVIWLRVLGSLQEFLSLGFLDT